MAEGEAQRLNNSHYGKYDAHSAGGAGTQLPNEKGIRHIIKSSDQHTDDRGNGQAGDQAGNGLVGHAITFGFHCSRTPLNIKENFHKGKVLSSF